MVLTTIRRIGMPAVAALVIAACGSDLNRADASTHSIVVTTSIWADIAERVACSDTFEVRTIVPNGVDPHAYEASLQDRELLDDAALVVANGLDLEESLVDTLDAVEGNGVPVFEFARHLPTLGEGDRADPHVWFDPTRVSAALPSLGEALIEAGGDPDAVQRCVSAAQADLAALDRDVEDTLAAIPPERRILVTNHDALAYFADRYGLRILGTVLPSTSTMTAASPGELEALAHEIEAAGVPAIFTETFAARDDADRLAESLGIEVVELHTDALSEAGDGAASYEELLRYDADAIARALE